MPPPPPKMMGARPPMPGAPPSPAGRDARHPLPPRTARTAAGGGGGGVSGAPGRWGRRAGRAGAGVAAATAATLLLLLPALAAAARGPATWRDVSASSGLTLERSTRYGGALVADIDGDGFYDILSPGHDITPVGVYWNNRDGTYTRAPDLEPFLSDVHGFSAGDVDGDGDLEVIHALGGGNGLTPFAPVFYATAGRNLTVADVGLGVVAGRGRSPRLVDLDGDGDLDILAINYEVVTGAMARQHVFENTGGGNYVRRFGSGIDSVAVERLILTDVDGDGRLDIVAYPFFRILLATGDFTFRDATRELLGRIPSWAPRLTNVRAAAELDYDNDGRMDLYLAMGERNDALLRNTGSGYEEVSVAAGIPQGGNHQAVTVGDFNNDGYMDIFVVRYGPRRLADLLLTADGEGGFSSSTNHGATLAPGNGRGEMATAFDSNRDGRLDLIVASGEQVGPSSTWGTMALFQNTIPYTNDGRYLVVRVGRSPNGRAVALGALLTLRTNGGTNGGRYVRRVGSSGATFTQSNLNIVHFGVGTATRVIRLTVRWSDGSVVTLTTVGRTNQVTTVGLL